MRDSGLTALYVLDTRALKQAPDHAIVNAATPVNKCSRRSFSRHELRPVLDNPERSLASSSIVIRSLNHRASITPIPSEPPIIQILMPLPHRIHASAPLDPNSARNQGPRHHRSSTANRVSHTTATARTRLTEPCARSRRTERRWSCASATPSPRARRRSPCSLRRTSRPSRCLCRRCTPSSRTRARVRARNRNRRTPTPPPTLATVFQPCGTRNFAPG
ncbi:hypothetical protein GY45DRAFT_291775 [Cubamyces sp. BRFM 1775]|nr:hypothetical protein GY45DRAFT_291775 [Cubamyces sp. BRFM 1775]